MRKCMSRQVYWSHPDQSLHQFTATAAFKAFKVQLLFPLVSAQTHRPKEENFSWHMKGWIHNNFLCVYQDIHFNHFWQLTAFMKSVECYAAVVRLHLSALARVRAREQCESNIWADSQYVHTLEQKTRMSKNGNKRAASKGQCRENGGGQGCLAKQRRVLKGSSSSFCNYAVIMLFIAFDL